MKASCLHKIRFNYWEENGGDSVKSKRVNKTLQAFILKHYMALSYNEKLKSQGFSFPPTQKPRFRKLKDGGMSVRFIYPQEDDNNSFQSSVTLQIPPEEMTRISCAIFSNGVKNTLNRVTKFNNQQISCHYD